MSLSRHEIEYIAGLVRMDLRKKTRDLEKFERLEGQEILEALKIKNKFANRVEFISQTLDHLNKLRTSSGSRR